MDKKKKLIVLKLVVHILKNVLEKNVFQKKILAKLQIKQQLEKEKLVIGKDLKKEEDKNVVHLKHFVIKKNNAEKLIENVNGLEK